MTEGMIAFGGGMIIFGGFLFIIVWTYLSFVAKLRCDKCERKKAMEKTGVWRSHQYSIFAIEYAIDQYEQQCKYCGHIRWRKMADESYSDNG